MPSFRSSEQIFLPVYAFLPIFLPVHAFLPIFLAVLASFTTESSGLTGIAVRTRDAGYIRQLRATGPLAQAIGMTDCMAANNGKT